MAVAYLNRNFFSANSCQADNDEPQLKQLPKSQQIRLEKAFSSSLHLKIRKLILGDISDYQSPSEADLAICRYLASYFDCNEGLIDKFFRESALYRKKWDEKRNSSGETYGQMTIQKAITSVKDLFQGNQVAKYDDQKRSFTFIPISEYIKKDFPDYKDVIGNKILVEGGSLILAGESGIGKSLIVLEWAINLAMGSSMYGGSLIVPKPRKVMILQSENSEFEVIHRLRKMSKNPAIENLFIIDEPLYGFDLLDPINYQQLIDSVIECDADVLIIDPLSSFHQCNENDNSQMRRVMESITNIARKTGAAIIIVHHFGKPSEIGLVA